MHPDVTILTAQSHIDDLHRAASRRRLSAEARRATAQERSAQLSQPRLTAPLSVFRRLMLRLAI